MGWTVQQTWAKEYLAICREAVLDDTVFNKFKIDYRYTRILEHLNLQQGIEYRNIALKQWTGCFNLTKLATSDALGSPVLHKQLDNLSANTWRYIKVATDIRMYFGNSIGFDIVEIGGGYGGQCKIINDILGFKSYTLIDLPDPLALQSKFLNRLNVNNVSFMDAEKLELIPECDLVISNYAFSELSKDLMQLYINRIFKGAKRGYLTISNSHLPPASDVKDLLPKGWSQIEEKPLTSKNGYIAIWK